MRKGGLRPTQPQKSHCCFIKGSSWGAGSPEEAKPECGIAAGSHRHAMGDGTEQKHTVMHGDDSLLGREASEHSWGSLNSGQLGERAYHEVKEPRTKDTGPPDHVEHKEILIREEIPVWNSDRALHWPLTLYLSLCLMFTWYQSVYWRTDSQKQWW